MAECMRCNTPKSLFLIKNNSMHAQSMAQWLQFQGKNNTCRPAAEKLLIHHLSPGILMGINPNLPCQVKHSTEVRARQDATCLADLPTHTESVNVLKWPLPL